MHPGYKKALEELKKERDEEFTKELHKIFDEAEEVKKQEEPEKNEVEKEDEFNLDDIFDD